MQFDMLVIDDDEPITLLCQKALSGPHHKVTTASSGEEARKLLAENVYHIVVTDMQLPDATGLELTELIKKNHPETEVIVLTGYVGMDVTAKAMKLGAYAYLMKPLNLVSLKSTINHCVERRILRGRFDAVKTCVDTLNKTLEDFDNRMSDLPTGPRVGAAAEKQAYQAVVKSLTDQLARLNVVLRL